MANWTDRYKKYLRNFNPSSSRFDATLPIEHEDIERRAKMWLYCRAVKSSSSQQNLNTNQQVDPETISLQYTHWALVFEFGDGAVRVIEGMNDNDTVVPSFSKSIDSGYYEIMQLGEGTISPIDVRNLAINNSYNGSSYSLLSSNCHAWVNAILSTLGLNPIPFTISEEIQEWIVTAGIAAGASVVGLALLGLFFGTRKQSEKE